MRVAFAIRQFAKRIIRGKTREYYRRLFNSYGGTFYSQEGEDALLAKIFGEQTAGYYVDVGAHHPARFSNTYYFYQRGWRGINIDPLPGSRDNFTRWRPKDTTLELAIGETRGTLTYYMFDEPALNGFNDEVASMRNKRGAYRVIGTKEVDCIPFSELMEKHLPAGQRIDFLTIDVEGSEMSVLRSNDWAKFRPSLVLAECLQQASLADVVAHPVSRFMEQRGYIPFARTFHTVFFAESQMIAAVKDDWKCDGQRED